MSEDLYTNSLADEFLPGTMYPFNWSVLAGVMDASWNRIRRDLRVEGEAVPFVRTFYHHAYWNMTRISETLRSAGLPQPIIDRLFEPPTIRPQSISDEESFDRVLALDRSAIAQNLEQSIQESERRLNEIQRKKGEWETEEEMVKEFDLILEVIGDVIFRETASWLLVGLNLSLLDEWNGRRQDVKRRRDHDKETVPQPLQSKVDEVRSMANRYHSCWELSRTVRALGRGLAEESLYALGERFVKWNLLGAKEDVRYLTVHEVRQIVSGGCSTNTCNNYALRARVRRTEMDQHAAEGLPPVIKGEAAPLLPWKKEDRRLRRS